MKKQKSTNDQQNKLVFTTGKEGNSFFNHIILSNENDPNTENNKNSMVVRVSLDRKQRKGKEVTIVKGLELDASELKDLAKELKTKCGTGGSVKDNEIILQGNFVKKLIPFLQSKGFTNTKQSGGA